jgi:hypothetical protein
MNFYQILNHLLRTKATNSVVSPDMKRCQGICHVHHASHIQTTSRDNAQHFNNFCCVVDLISILPTDSSNEPLGNSMTVLTYLRVILLSTTPPLGDAKKRVQHCSLTLGLDEETRKTGMKTTPPPTTMKSEHQPQQESNAEATIENESRLQFQEPPPMDYKGAVARLLQVLDRLKWSCSTTGE